MKKLTNKNKAKLFASALGVAFITLLLLPANFFDTGQAMCLSVLLANTTCYGCGMTRAVQHILHFEFSTAYEYNKLAFIVVPLAMGLFIWEIKKLYNKPD
jgi:hypothetical protein